ncbi:LIM domain protein [Onchocerca flexuosa]|uniref:LIM domain protein n=1 Tax=Onchocerca flexuosa TaxID=387005 RepID=A0A238BU30_9BILA|nr:LIM domain protein [Onchocerca flexuosa]
MVNLGSESSTVSPKVQTFSSSSKEDCDDMTVPSTVPPTVPYTFAGGIVCNGCGFEIKEKYMMKLISSSDSNISLQIDDNCWHENCLICCTCRIPLNGSSCYSRSGQFYCKEDYIVTLDCRGRGKRSNKSVWYCMMNNSQVNRHLQFIRDSKRIFPAFLLKLIS